MKVQLRMRGRLTEAVTLLGVLGGLSFSWVSNAAPPVKLTPAKPVAAPSAAPKAPPAAGTTANSPPSPTKEGATTEADSEVDPCLSSQVDQQVQCVAQFSEKLTAVCLQGTNIQQELAKLAKAAFARLPEAEQRKRIEDAKRAADDAAKAKGEADSAEAEATKLESAAKQAKTDAEKAPAAPAAPPVPPAPPLGEAAKRVRIKAATGKAADAPKPTDPKKLAEVAETVAKDKRAEAGKKRETANKAAAEAVAKKLLVDMADPAADTAIVTAVCATLCPDQARKNAAGAQDADGSLCAMTKHVQNAAVVAAWDDVLEARAYVAKELSKVGALSVANKEDLTNSSAGRLGQEVSTGSAHTSAGFDTVGVATKFLQGLAKLIVDRAKTEAIGWFLDRMGTELCGKDAKELSAEQREIKTYWLPQVCTLAEGARLSAYGGGGAMLESLRAAIEADVQGWPGAAVSLVPAEIYRADAKPVDADAKPVGSIIDCSAQSSAHCEAINTIRTETQKRISELLKGRDPLASLHDLSTAYHHATGAPAKSSNLQATACGLGLPRDVRQFADAFTVSLPKATDRVHAALLASLVNVPACNAIVAKNRSSTPLLKNLNTLLLLERSVGIRLVDAESRLTQLNTALKELDEAAGALSEATKKLAESPSPALPNEDDAGKVLNVVRAFELGRAEGALSPARQRVARALIAVADTGITLAQSGTHVAEGFCTAFQSVATLKCPTPDSFTNAQARLEEIKRYITVAGDAAAGDWAKASISVLAALHQSNAVRGASATRQKLLRYVGILAAIVNARSSDDVAKALDEAANPVGGWKAKGIPNTRTVSLTAHAGFFGAIEVRHGTYGATYEDWASHYQAPALALPVGLELSSGYDWPLSPIGWFFPLLDPAAFLQYDAERDGKLPGASLKTALSPGVGLRIGFRDTPFSIMPMVVYRPGFRQWDAKLTGTGADAVQFGLMLDVDVTLFQFAHWEKDQ